MAHFEFNGSRIEVVEDWRIGEQIEAENALDLDLGTARSAAKTALVLYMSIRRVDKDTPAGALADQVMAMNLTELADEGEDEVEEGEAGPPASEPEEGNEGDAEPSNGDSGIDARRITGRLHSASSA